MLRSISCTGNLGSDVGEPLMCFLAIVPRLVGLFLRPNPQRLHLAVQIASLQPQQFRRSRDVPVGLARPPHTFFFASPSRSFTCSRSVLRPVDRLLVIRSLNEMKCTGDRKST